MNRYLLPLALSLAGCASAPVHYHTLSAPAVAQGAGAPVAFAIDVLPVGIPAQLDQQQLVVREGASNLKVEENERWSGPYADEIRNALAAQLAASLHAPDVTGLGAAPGQKVLRIQVQVRRFDAWIGDRVQFDATWRLGFANAAADARLLCASQFDVPVRGGYPEVVQGQQAAVARLAEDIAATARGIDSGACTRAAALR